MSYLPIKIKEVIEKMNSSYFLPHIQRELVWKTGQIYKLFDSLMRGYPISTFLFWSITDLKEDITKLEFVKDWSKGVKNVPNNENQKGKIYSLVLDGQQRLQSFYISLKGTYEGKELFFNALSKKPVEDEDDEEENEIIYETSFFKGKKTCYYEEVVDKKSNQKTKKFWIKVKDFSLLEGMDKAGMREISKFVLELKKDPDIKNLSIFEWELLDENIKKLNEIMTKEDIYYYEEKGEDYDKVLDIFIRTNAGGTKLSKSDLLFSIIKLKWKNIDAYQEFKDLTNSINSKGEFEFDNDFVLKTALVLINTDIKYKVENFKEKNIKQIEENWDKIKEGIKIVIDLIVNQFGITSKKQLTSKNSLIPIINYAYVNKIKSFDENKADIVNSNKLIKKWLFSAWLTNLFSGQTDELLKRFREVINSNLGVFPFDKLNANLPGGKSISISKENFDKIEYGDGNDFFLLGLLYPEFNPNPISDRNKPHKDHIFPETLLEKKKISSDLINNIGNLELLTATENESKNAKQFDIWINSLDKSFVDKNCIPIDSNLWKIENYEEFLKKRREIMFRRIFDILK